ncbi:Uncharacterized protein HZ326_16343 [Fusarium oxysporum f. sp. albedinis]|nr:Uncharacterized protein HZ326_16343 [Fusarium oxysporum f. sp. albedinis]
MRVAVTYPTSPKSWSKKKFILTQGLSVIGTRHSSSSDSGSLSPSRSRTLTHPPYPPAHQWSRYRDFTIHRYYGTHGTSFGQSNGAGQHRCSVVLAMH